MDRVEKLVSKERHGWIVELDDGEQVSVSFSMIAVVRSVAEIESEPSEAQFAEVAPVEMPTSETSAEASEVNSNSDAGNSEQDITKMTVKQLQALAKQRGIGIARIKSDFLRIIKEKNPDEDLDQLVGKTLFNRVRELHISRLRAKEELVWMLSE